MSDSLRPSLSTDAFITLAHGEGARATRALIAKHVVPHFDNDYLRRLPDAAHLNTAANRIAMTTDSFVVSPLFFPGGDIGSMSVYGTVNDLAVSGATPRWISLALIIEEGFSLPELDRILSSVATAAKRCDVTVVTGDTKVVPRGAADGLFINTTGIAEVSGQVPPGPEAIQIGDALIVSGPIGCHGIAVLASRDEIAFEPMPQSDSAPLNRSVATLLKQVGPSVRTIRDATRGGVSAVLHEWAEACDLTMRLNESALPVTDEVRGACELLGLDPLYIANEGTMLVAVDPAAEHDAIAALQTEAETRHAVCIGYAGDRSISPVTVRRLLGGEQPIDEPTGAMLPRIC